MSAVEGVMDDHLALGEELGVWTADARVLDLLVIAPIVDRDDMEGLAHASSYRPQDGSFCSRAPAEPAELTLDDRMMPCDELDPGPHGSESERRRPVG
jgi:hypothetical protein